MRRLNRWTDAERRVLDARSGDRSRREDDSDADPNDRGSAALEFIVVGLLLLVPIIYLVVALGAVQGQTLGAESGARHIARAISTAPDAATARERADAVLRSIVDEYGIDPDSVQVSMTCHPTGAVCPDAGATVVVTVSTTVALPLAPPVFGLDRLARIPIEASAAQKVSRFWGAG
ncbi:MAG: TadE family protein [Actinobacteria bacterium]|nr:TadE family protein [Actinomycetota bacterium]